VSRAPLRFQGHIRQLRKLVACTGHAGEWSFHELNSFWMFRSVDGAALNWWPATGTVTFQGLSDEREKLRLAILRVARGKHLRVERGQILHRMRKP
jgi:hypothetical protein